MDPRPPDAFCPYYHRAVELIGRRWTGAIVRALLSDVQRFSDFAGTIPGLSDRMLSERLKELEAEGIIVRRVVPDKPVRIEYHLTAKGRDLGTAVKAVSSWAEQWLGASPDGAPAMPAQPFTPADRASGSPLMNPSWPLIDSTASS